MFLQPFMNGQLLWERFRVFNYFYFWMFRLNLSKPLDYKKILWPFGIKILSYQTDFSSMDTEVKAVVPGVLLVEVLHRPEIRVTLVLRPHDLLEWVSMSYAHQEDHEIALGVHWSHPVRVAHPYCYCTLQTESDLYWWGGTRDIEGIAVHVGMIMDHSFVNLLD